MKVKQSHHPVRITVVPHSRLRRLSRVERWLIEHRVRSWQATVDAGPLWQATLGALLMGLIWAVIFYGIWQLGGR